MPFDILIRNGRVLDGTGATARVADVGIRGTVVASVGRIRDSETERTIDADGKYVAPGFIDIHTHSDVGILVEPTAECAVRQGVTTHVIGNCGDSPAPVSDEYRELAMHRFEYYSNARDWKWSTYGEYLRFMEQQGVGINIAGLVGHGAIRLAVMGFEERPPTGAELDSMKGHVDEAMRSGAFGMSTGLVYPPGCFAATDEIVALAGGVVRHGGFYASHIRGERETIVDAVKECIAIGEQTGCRVQISHNNPKYGGLGKGPEIQKLWESARARGVDVLADNDAHTDFGPPLSHALPQWSQKLSTNELLAILQDPEKRQELKAEIMADRNPGAGYVGLLVHERFDRIWILRSPGDPSKEGLTIAALASHRGIDPWSVYFDLIVEDQNRAVGLFDYMDLEEIKATLRHPLVMICSDGWVAPKEERTSPTAPYQPCTFGEFPGILQRFVVEEPVLTLENAVYKMTGMPAARLGLSDRGLVRPGFAADLVVFDLPRVRDRATNLWPHTYPFENYPHDFPEGIDWVLVNGRLAVEDGLPTGSLTGQVLRHPGHSEKPVRPRTSGRTVRSRQGRGRRSRSRRRRSPEPVPGTRSTG
ncbi:MAG: D-aminoacylase [Methanobacteriota archaeon]|nr:MAG: D-aminoacylase [Euryarchaeota archaeon]